MICRQTLQAVGSKTCLGEVLFIIANDGVSSALYGRCQNMPILRVIGHAGSQCVICLHQSFWKMLLHRPNPAGNAFCGVAKLDQSAVKFTEDFCRPARCIKRGFRCQSQERVRNRHRSQYTCIQQRYILVNPHRQTRAGSCRRAPRSLRPALIRGWPSDVAHLDVPYTSERPARRSDDAYQPCGAGSPLYEAD